MTDVSRLPGPMIDAWEWQYEAACPVIEQCRSYALAAQEPYGIWGGMTEEERREEIRSSGRGRRVS